MQALPVSFLKEIATYCQLTEKQAEAFIAFYSQDKNKKEIAGELNISSGALYQRLIKVYDNISDRQDSNKVNNLRELLVRKYQTKDSSSIYQFAIHYRIEIVKEQKIDNLRIRYYNGDDIRKKINSFPNNILQIKHLTQLDLSNNDLQELPRELSNLTNLIELDISWNNLQTLTESTGSLTKLTKLNLSVNNLDKLPESIGNLTELKILNLNANKLKKLPESIKYLVNLTDFYFSGNYIERLPDNFGNLVSLNRVDLLGNRLEKLPKSIVNIINLTQLNLKFNNLKQLPNSIGKLTNLSVLNLYGNNLRKLPISICNLNNIEYWNLYNNPLEIPPIGIAEQGIEAIKRYFRQLKEEGEDYIYEAKLLIVGEGGAGKTTLANKIQNADYQLPDERNDTSTEGIDVQQFKFKLDDEKEFYINIWDFGGQEIYHATHQFFLTKRSLYILVADSRKEDTDFYYWLNVVELLSDNSPILIVNNEKLERKRDINEKALRGQFDNLKETLSSNLKTNRGLDTILNKIEHYIQNLPHIGQALPKTWVKVRQALEKNPHNYISLQEYYVICRENGFTQQKDKLQLSGYLHDLGVCLHFQEKEDSLLYKTIILKPEWGTKAVYKVLDNDAVKDNRGNFTRKDLINIWSNKSYGEMRGELLELMKKFQLCYEIPSRPNTFIAPQLLSENQPDYDWHDSNNLTLRYNYPDFMPKGIITRFIVIMHQYIDYIDKEDLVWKTGVILYKDGARAEVIEYYGRRIITIRISGKNKRDLMTIVTHEIDKLSDSFRQLKYSKRIPCNCTSCRSGNKPNFYDFQKLKDFIKDGHPKIQCQESYAMVDVRSLIDDVIIWNREIAYSANSMYMPEEDMLVKHINRSNREREPMTNLEKEVFISYAWSEESKAITDLIDETFQEKGINILRDKKNIGYKDSIRQFMQNLGEGKCVILIISKKYLESPNCMFELMEISDNGDFLDRIFPVILSGTNIFNPLDRINYIKYWQDKTKELNQAVVGIEDQSNLHGIREDLDLYNKIRDNFARLTDTLRDMNNLTSDIHIDSEFKELFEAVIEKIEE